jgi:hypothetical protein
MDFEPVSYDLRISEQPGNVILGVSGDFSDVEIVKSLSVAFPFSKDGGPAQACLCALQDQKLE